MAAIIIGYLLGSIPFALLSARRRGLALREEGDRTLDPTNVQAQAGTRAALPAFIGDLLKGLIAGLIGLALGHKGGAYLGVLGVMVGDAFPVFARFRGARAAVPLVGGALALSPLGWLIALELGGVGWAGFSKKVGARAAVLSFPIWQLITTPSLWFVASYALIGLAWLRSWQVRRRGAPDKTAMSATRAEARAGDAEKLAKRAEKEMAKAREMADEARGDAAEAERLAREGEDHAQRAERQQAERRHEQPSELEQEAAESGRRSSAVREQALALKDEDPSDRQQDGSRRGPGGRGPGGRR